MPATAYTRATLTAEVQAELQDDNGVYFTDAKVWAWINDAMAEWCRETKTRRYTWTVNLVADQAAYSHRSLTPRPIDVQDYYIPASAGSDQRIRLPKISQEELNGTYPTWQTQPSSWPQRVSRFTKGLSGFVLHPAPSSSQASEVREGTIVANQPRGIIRSIRGLGTAAATTAYGATVAIRFLLGAITIEGIAHSTDLALDADSLETVGGIDVEYQDAIKARVLLHAYAFDVAIAQPNKLAKAQAVWDEAMAKATRLVRAGFQSKPAESQRGSNI